MAFSLCQYLAERYYRRMNYVVEKNIPILPEEGEKQFWSDLDLLAIGSDVLLVSCKDFLPSSKQREDIVKNLNIAKDYINKNYQPFSEKEFRKQYVYIMTDKETLNYLRKENIETIPFDDLLVRYIKELDKFLTKINEKSKASIKIGTRYYRIGNLEDLDKFLAYLLNYSFLNEGKINQQLEHFKLPLLSETKSKRR